MTVSSDKEVPMEFQCRRTYENGHFQEWTGSWELVHYNGSFWELLINGRGSSFHTILGISSAGLYICIPSIDVGCGLAGWTDTFWNTEKLSGFVSVTDAVTIAEAVRSFARY